MEDWIKYSNQEIKEESKNPKISIDTILQDTLNYWRDFVKNDLY